MRGSGNVVTETREVSGIDAVQLAVDGTLTIHQGDEEGLTIEAEDNILPLLETRVERGTLTIRYDRRVDSIRPTRPVRLQLAVRGLSAIGVSGSGQVEAPALRAEKLELVVSGSGAVTLGELQARELETVISGSGRVEASGEVGSQGVRISGSGDLSAEGLRGGDAAVVISGSGRATASVGGKLAVTITGSGELRYRGNPAAVTQVITGSGRVTRIAA